MNRIMAFVCKFVYGKLKMKKGLSCSHQTQRHLHAHGSLACHMTCRPLSDQHATRQSEHYRKIKAITYTLFYLNFIVAERI